MFFTRFWFYLLGLLPARGRFSRSVRVTFGYYDCRDKIATWHFAELKKLDPLFALSQEALRISAAYDQAEAAGIGPSDPRYPRLFGIWSVAGYPQERVDAVTKACTDALKQKDR